MLATLNLHRSYRHKRSTMFFGSLFPSRTSRFIEGKPAYGSTTRRSVEMYMNILDSCDTESTVAQMCRSFISSPGQDTRKHSICGRFRGVFQSCLWTRYDCRYSGSSCFGNLCEAPHEEDLNNFGDRPGRAFSGEPLVLAYHEEIM